jgi:ribonuclease P protein component
LKRTLLPPLRTLSKDSDFRRVYRKGKSYATSRLVIYAMKRYAKLYGAGDVRVGLSVSGKVAKAVTRNKLRRRLKEILRLDSEKLARGFDMVIVARNPSADAGYAELEGDVRYLLGKLGVSR